MHENRNAGKEKRKEYPCRIGSSITLAIKWHCIRLAYSFIRSYNASHPTTACNNTPADKLVFYKIVLIKVDHRLPVYINIARSERKHQPK
jgi:hypothetical protein